MVLLIQFVFLEGVDILLLQLAVASLEARNLLDLLVQHRHHLLFGQPLQIQLFFENNRRRFCHLNNTTAGAGMEDAAPLTE